MLTLLPGAHAADLRATVRDDQGRPLADAVVVAIPEGAAPAEARHRLDQIEQRDREFVPFLTILQTGTAVSFPNHDTILHHVYSFSPAKSFEIKLYTGTPPGQIVFDKPGVVTLGCNIHDWMIAYIVVVQSRTSRAPTPTAGPPADLPAGATRCVSGIRCCAAPRGGRAARAEASRTERVAFVLDDVAQGRPSRAPAAGHGPGGTDGHPA